MRHLYQGIALPQDEIFTLVASPIVHAMYQFAATGPRIDIELKQIHLSFQPQKKKKKKKPYLRTFLCTE
jgi:hypothetical protein